jgi:ssDNA thymidine ADP-ribosyltransferase, DarT
VPPSLAELLTPDRALVFRITHRNNVPHLLANGAHCRTSPVVNPHYAEIGHPDIIDRRTTRAVPVAPGGTLADYVPFYFTPCSPMLYKIVTGHGGLRQRARSEIVILVSSFARLEQAGATVLIADRNATLEHAAIQSGRDLLASLPWKTWRVRDFKHDPDKPDKFERYQAEALVHRVMPVGALLGIIAYDQAAQVIVAQAVAHAGLSIPVHVRSHWYP